MLGSKRAVVQVYAAGVRLLDRCKNIVDMPIVVKVRINTLIFKAEQ